MPVSIIFGFVEATSNLKDKTVEVHGMLIGRTKEWSADDEWDYGKYAITNKDEWIPLTHGEISGSAAWRIDFPMDGSARKALRLEGVVYAEGPEKNRKLIAYG